MSPTLIFNNHDKNNIICFYTDNHIISRRNGIVVSKAQHTIALTTLLLFRISKIALYAICH